MATIHVNKSTIKGVSGNSVEIDNPVLARVAEDDPSFAASFLGLHVAPVAVSDITVDQNGVVVVSNPAFAQAIANALPGPPLAGPLMDPPDGDRACGDIACGDHACGDVACH